MVTMRYASSEVLFMLMKTTPRLKYAKMPMKYPHVYGIIDWYLLQEGPVDDLLVYEDWP